MTISIANANDPADTPAPLPESCVRHTPKANMRHTPKVNMMHTLKANMMHTRRQ